MGATSNLMPTDVCDTNASSCPEWKSHCRATHTQRRWVDLRKSWQASRRGGQSASGSASSSSAAATTSASGPSSTSPATCGPPKPPSRRLSTEERRRWPVDEILKAVEQVYPIEAPEPAGFCSAYRLRPCAGLARTRQALETDMPPLSSHVEVVV